MAFLHELYPIERAPARDLLSSLAIGVFVFLFLLVFRPFGISSWQTPFLVLKLAGYGVVSFLVMLLYYFILPMFITPLRRTEQWTVGNELLGKFLILSLIAVFNFAYLKSPLMGWGKPVQFHVSFAESYGYTFLLGIFPVAGLVCLNYILQLNKYVRLAAALPVHELPGTARHDSTENAGPADLIKLSFIAENGLDEVSVQLEQLIFIEAEENYTGIHYFLDGIPVKRLLRNSLSRIESQAGTDVLVRCHRSFIVNLSQVDRVIGNAQGFRFCIRNSAIQVPVGRKYNEVVQQYRAACDLSLVQV